MLQAYNIQLMRYIEGQCLNPGRESKSFVRVFEDQIPSLSVGSNFQPGTSSGQVDFNRPSMVLLEP